MKVAVLTVTRDRLDYTKHCFGRLRDLAGCGYDHWGYDNGSTDGTPEWLADNGYDHWLFADANHGICPALNRLLDSLGPTNYDALVRFDNDCELIQPDTLKICAEIAVEYEAIVSPKVQGLHHPPPTIGRVRAGEWLIHETPVLGGIFMAIPATLFTERGFRYANNHPPYGGDELIVPWWRERGGHAGYVDGLAVNHYERVDEQRDKYRDYQRRKETEMASR